MTWIQFKIDFMQAVQDLRWTGNLQARTLYDNILHANLIQDVREVIQETSVPLLEAAQAPQDYLPAPAPEYHLNSATSTFHHFQSQIQQMQQTMLQMQTTLVNNSDSSSR